MEIQFDRLAVIVNRARRDEDASAISRLKADIGADYCVSLPEDGELVEMGENGTSLWSIAPSNPVIERLDAFLSRL